MSIDENANLGVWADDAFLDRLRLQGDPPADECFQELAPILRVDDFRDLFRRLDRNDVTIPGDVPAPLSRYLENARMLPRLDGVPLDLARIERGQTVFMTHLFPAVAVLLMKSLPEGYAAPNLSVVLNATGNLERRTYRRLLGVVQLLVNVSEVGGFAPGGEGLISLAKVRLLHAGVRHVVRQELPEYEARFGVPANTEDLLGTIMGFSYLVVAGLERLRIHLNRAEAEDFYYLWRVAGSLMGIGGENDTAGDAGMPPDLKQAAVFYESYSRRHFVAAADNPAGTALARADLEMLDRLLPQTPLRRLGLNFVPRLFMETLMGREAMARVGISPAPILPLTRLLIVHLPALWNRLWRRLDRLDPTGSRHAELSARFLRDMVVQGRDGEVTFRLPDTLEEFEAL